MESFTGYYDNLTFMEQLRSVCPKLQGAYCLAAVDIEHFRLFNKIYGRQAGDRLIKDILKCLLALTDECGGLTGYFGADNFAVLLPDDAALLERLRDALIETIRAFHPTISFYPLIGVYPIDDVSVLPETMYDRATLALSQSPEQHAQRICRYAPSMESDLEKEVLLLSEIQKGLENEEFTFFAQPQCDISTGKIVGAEALVRWKKPDGTFVSPGVFIPALENNGMISQLDRYVWERVFRWLRAWIDRGYSPVPMSINVSRIDILSMDVPRFLFSLLEKYRLSERLIKVEITESAYAESNDHITQTVNRLRGKGLKVMMDDFGSGYSSLNMLKNIPVDVLKLDMRFLEIGENDDEKGINILESVINMARLLRLPIVVEGVETQKQEQFVQNLGCRYTQGFYYYKPLPIETFEQLLADDKRLDHHGLLYKQVEPLHIREFLDQNFFSDSMLNNILGPIAFYELYEHQLKITRVNEQYFRLSGATRESTYGKRFWNHVLGEDRPRLYTIFEKAYEDPSGGAVGYIHFQRMDGSLRLIYMKAFYLKEKDGKRQFCASLTDMTDLSPAQTAAAPDTAEYADLPENLDTYFSNMPGGFSINRLLLDEEGRPADFEIVYINEQLRLLCDGSRVQMKELFMHPFAENVPKVFDAMYRAAYGGENVEFCLYSHLSGRYLRFRYYQFRKGYVASIMLDNTHNYLSEKMANSILHSYREAYFIHLRDNIYRMLYPDENNLMERGSYEDAIVRHFQNSLILPDEEKTIRRFLSLDNLRKVLRKQDTTELAYKRSCADNTIEWCLTSLNVVERDADGTPTTAIMLIRSIDGLIHSSRNRRRQAMSRALSTMSEGFFIYQAFAEEKLLFANERVFQIYGCDSAEDFRAHVHDSFQGMVHPDDLPRVEQQIQDQIRHSDRNMDHIEYRIIRKDGTIRWIDDYGHLERGAVSADIGAFYVYITDVTDTLPQARKNALIVQSRRSME